MEGYVKAPRFMKEFASHKKRELKGNKLMQDRYKKEGCEFIDWAVKNYERGMITTDETMGLIINCFK